MHYQSLVQLSAALRSGAISSVELTRLYLERSRTANAVLNCYISLDEEHAMACAARADTRMQASAQTVPPLTGIPIAHKDNFCTKGQRTSCGSKMLHNFLAPYDAHVVSQLHEAGAVTLGKTNMDEFAMGSSSETSYYGPVRNPWDTGRVPGGSSGGSAAAVASGLTAAATGTDTGGSIRQPAALCGVTGIKPTYGRVSRYGMVAFASSLDQGGAIARSAEDAALLLQHMSGFDTRDSTSAQHPVPDYMADLAIPLHGLRIGLPKECFHAGLDADIAAAVEQAVQVLQNQGAIVTEISLASTNLAVPTYYVLATAECSSNLARYDGVRFGYRCKAPKNLHDMYCRTRSEGFGREVKRRLLTGTYALSSGYYEAYYRKAQQIRRLISQDYLSALSQLDLILTPTTPDVAFVLGERSEDPVKMYLSDLFTVPANLVGLPALSLPAGFKGHLPIGMQLIGNHFAEALLLRVAHRFQCQTDWHIRRPPETETVLDHSA